MTKLEEFVEKLKEHFKDKQSCYTYSDGYVCIGNNINEDIDDLLEEFKDE